MRELLNQLLALGNGFVPLEELMRQALYHPRIGYYSQNVETVGKEGDFTTAPEISATLGEAIAHWVQTRSREMNLSRPCHLIEIGPGTGALAKAVARELGWRERRKYRFHLVERSLPLCKAQRKFLGRHFGEWHNSVEGALTSARGNALIYSNELVDAFPCKVLQLQQNKEWQEIGFRDDASADKLSLATRKIPETLMNELRRYSFWEQRENFSTGQVIEVQPSYLKWQGQWIESFRSGAVLTIDYGAPAARDVYYRRPNGTLRAYFRQERFEGLTSVFTRLGQQDITADVTFDDLIKAGNENGLKTKVLVTLADFLREWSTEKCDGAGRLKDRHDAGGEFFVLEQRRD